MESQLQNKIKELNILIYKNNYRTECLNQELKDTIILLQQNCVHKFVRESDNDYHSAKYYNVCSICNIIE
jgi:hypothetical protein